LGRGEKILWNNRYKEFLFSPIAVLANFTFFCQIPYFFGEDIVNARTDYLSGPRIDFWGGTSSLVYGYFPSFGFRWQISLALVQILITAVGLNRIFSRPLEFNRNNLLGLFICYSALILGSQMTRDGLMFSLLTFGIGILKSVATAKLSNFQLVIGIMIIVFAMSFRPWTALAIVPLIYIIFHHSKLALPKFINLTLILSISLLPIALDVAASKSLRLEKSYPAQQVLLMDAAATFCYTTNSVTGEKAKYILTLFSDSERFPEIVCNVFRPDTWVSLKSAERLPSLTDEFNFHLIAPGEEKKFSRLVHEWRKLVLTDPISYFQNKIIFGGKLLVGSDTRGLSFLSQDSTRNRILAMYRIPYELAISLHLYSIAASIIYLLLLPIRKFIRNLEDGLKLDRISVFLIFSQLLWLWLSSIAYIGSNGRYTYTVVLLSSALYLGLKTDSKAIGTDNV
jgi:hypothetical protein